MKIKIKLWFDWISKVMQLKREIKRFKVKLKKRLRLQDIDLLPSALILIYLYIPKKMSNYFEGAGRL